MTPEPKVPVDPQLIASAQATFDRCIATMRLKNADYATTQNAWVNFEGAKRLGVPVHIGIMIRLQDKFSRIENLMSKEPDVVGESLIDSLEDAINYLAIIKARLEYDARH